MAQKIKLRRGKVEKLPDLMEGEPGFCLDTGELYIGDGSKNVKMLQEKSDISNTAIAAVDTVSTEFPVPAAGESTRAFMGKVRKFFQDFNDFKTGIITVGKLVNNGQTTASGYALDARYGKTLADQIAQLNSDFSEDISSNITDYISKSATTHARYTKIGNIVSVSLYDFNILETMDAREQSIVLLTGLPTSKSNIYRRYFVNTGTVRLGIIGTNLYLHYCNVTESASISDFFVYITN